MPDGISLEGIAAVIGAITAAGALAWKVRQGIRDARDRLINEVSRGVRGKDPLWVFIDNLPLPCWQKDCDSRMQWLNAQYSIQFNIPPHRYEGQRDEAIWPRDVSEAFREHDRRVIDERVILETTEQVPRTAGDLSSPRDTWRVWKFPVFNSENDVVGVGGFCAPLDLSLAGYKEAPSKKRVVTDRGGGEVPPREGNLLGRWSWKRLAETNFDGFTPVLADLLGVPMVREYEVDR